MCVLRKDTRLASQFDDVPSYAPPCPPRPPARLPAIRALMMFAKDVLAPFEVAAFERPLTTRRILNRDLHIFNSPNFVRASLVGNHEALQRKTPQMRTALEPLLGDGLFVSDGEVWKERRALVAPIVHARHLRSFFPIMLDAAEEWRDEWARHQGGDPIDVLNEMGLLTAEIISRSVFGQRLGRKYTEQIVRSFAEYQRHVGQVALADMVQLPSWVPRFRGSEVKASAKRIQDVIDQIIDEHLKERRSETKGATARGDQTDAAEHETTGASCPQRAMIAQLFDAGESGNSSIDRDGIRNEAIVLFMAGHETTANTLAWAFYLISQADWVQKALHEEIDEVLGGRMPTFEDVDKLVYCRAIIEETLRLYPPVPILGREAVCPADIEGEHVKKGALAMVAPWLLHRNPNLWERPDDFIPERFLPSAGRPNKYQYVPFAIGPRVCPGLAFAMTESVVCLAVLAQAFSLTLAPGVDIQPKTRLTLRPGDTLPMLVTARTSATSPAAAA